MSRTAFLVTSHRDALYAVGHRAWAGRTSIDIYGWRIVLID